jgi:hypothetical protein
MARVARKSNEVSSAIVGGFLALAACVAQVQDRAPAVSLSTLMKGLEKPDLAKVSELTESVQHQGISFDLKHQELRAILAAGIKGKRDPEQMAQLILACLDVCQDCRARFVSPMTMDELKNILNLGFAPAAVLQEARARGVKDIQISEPAANVLRAAGADEELVSLLIPDDKIPAFPIAGYKTLTLKHAEDYDPAAHEGWLKITTELPGNSESEFIFKHNGLFERTVRGEDPKDLGSYFNKPAPRETTAESIAFEHELEGIEEKGRPLSGLRKRKPPPVEGSVSYLGAGPEGRGGFRILIANKEVSSQRCSFHLRWRVKAAPKTSTPAPTQ